MLCTFYNDWIYSIYFDSNTVLAAEMLLTCCQGLVTVDKEESLDLPVDPSHILCEYSSTYRNFFTNSHSMMAEVCLTYHI